MISLDVRVRPRPSLLVPSAVIEAATAQALNRARNNGRRVGLRAVAKEMGLRQKDLKKRGRIRKDSSKYGAMPHGRNATRRRLETSIIGRGRPFNAGRWDGIPIVRNGRVVARLVAIRGDTEDAP